MKNSLLEEADLFGMCKCWINIETALLKKSSWSQVIQVAAANLQKIKICIFEERDSCFLLWIPDWYFISVNNTSSDFSKLVSTPLLTLLRDNLTLCGDSAVDLALPAVQPQRARSCCCVSFFSRGGGDEVACMRSGTSQRGFCYRLRVWRL